VPGTEIMVEFDDFAIEFLHFLPKPRKSVSERVAEKKKELEESSLGEPIKP